MQIKNYNQKILKYKYDIIISGYYGFNNSGDDAILMATINTLKRLNPSIRILVMSNKPDETKSIYNVDAIHRKQFLKVKHYMKYSTVFLNGGGSLIQDVTSSRSLYFYLIYVLIAKWMKMKVVLYANGIGPVYKWYNKAVTKVILNKANLITLREPASYDALNDLKITKPKTIITADPALSIQLDNMDISTILSAFDIEPSDKVIGISVRSWKNNQHYVDLLAQSADYIINELDAKVLFIPMQRSKDMTIITDICNAMKNKCSVIDEAYHVNIILAIIKRLDLLIGMRLHALIYAVGMCVPVIGLVYDNKVDGFLQYTKQKSAGQIDSLDFNTLKSIINEVWYNKKNICNDLNNNIVELRKKAVQNAELVLELLD